MKILILGLLNENFKEIPSPSLDKFKGSFRIPSIQSGRKFLNSVRNFYLVLTVCLGLR